MDATHIHLIITHLPIYGFLLGAIVLGMGIIKNHQYTRIAGYVVLLISAIGGTIAYFTGEAAEETVEKIGGISHDLIEAHEDSATYAIAIMFITGLITILTLLIANRRTRLERFLSIALLILALASFGIGIRTGYLGGQIRHTEIHKAPGD